MCGIVSGAAGAAIAIGVAMRGDASEIVWVIVMSSLIAAFTVAGKAAGKTSGNKEEQRDSKYSVISSYDFC